MIPTEDVIAAIDWSEVIPEQLEVLKVILSTAQVDVESPHVQKAFAAAVSGGTLDRLVAFGAPVMVPPTPPPAPAVVRQVTEVEPRWRKDGTVDLAVRGTAITSVRVLFIVGADGVEIHPKFGKVLKTDASYPPEDQLAKAPLFELDADAALLLPAVLDNVQPDDRLFAIAIGYENPDGTGEATSVQRCRRIAG